MCGHDSPVIASSGRTGRSNASESSAVMTVHPRGGPILGCGTCRNVHVYRGLCKEAGGHTNARCLRARKDVRNVGTLLHHMAQLACSGTTNGMDGVLL